MAELRFHVDQCDAERLTGWADQDGPLPSLDVFVDDQWVASLAPTLYRQDLRDRRIGDGRRGFNLPLRGYLRDRESLIEVKCGERVLHQCAVSSGKAGPPEQPPSPEALFARSQERWKRDEPDAGLTWGRPMTGESLWDIYSAVRQFRPSDHILEIGPGYGRLLQTCLDRNVPFATYTGVELSPPRVARLSEKYGSEKIRFVVGDVNNWRGERPFDVILCSSTFEHLYPDCSMALRNLASQLAPEATVLIDFIAVAGRNTRFEPSGTYVRRYDEDELTALFDGAGLSVRKVRRCTIGEGARGDVARSVDRKS